MASQTTITKKQENKGAKGILDLTGTLGQVLKQFMGIYGKTLPDTDGLTVEDWMDIHGVHRFVDKKGKKGNYTPALLMDGWHDAMKLKDDQGKVMSSYVFRNVPAKVLMSDPSNPDGRAYYVFTKEEAEKENGKHISRYMLTAIEDTRWDVRTILKGLKQSYNFKDESAKYEKQKTEWEELEHVYIVVYKKVKNAQTGATEVLRKVVEVDKTRVMF